MQELIPEWSRHIAENLEACKKSLSFEDLPLFRADDCIVIGASPSLTDEELLKLKDFKGDIIVTNKSFERCFKRGLRIGWVVLLDAHPISASQFRWMEEFISRDIIDFGSPVKVEYVDDSAFRNVRFLVSSVAYPGTIKLLKKAGCKIYFFNPAVSAKENEPYRVSQMWGWMNNLPEFPHGGNVGTCAFCLARKLLYKRIGILGIDFCEEPGKDWTHEQARGYEYFYYPESKSMKFVAISKVFKSFIAYFIGAVNDCPGAVRYLGTSPLLKFSPYITSQSLDDFINGVDDEPLTEEEIKDLEISAQELKDGKAICMRPDETVEDFLNREVE
ncbi:MAG: 6-hydroxymethylpterin diphosphokinase MptE-like protein [Dehalococcoidia bacterium]|jgi:hypothetical protein